MEDAEATDLIEQLRLMEKQAHELVAQQHKVETLLRHALEKSPARHHKIVAERTGLGGEGSPQVFSA